MEMQDIDFEILDAALPDEVDATRFMLRYQQVMMLYESAIQCISMRLGIIGKECIVQGTHNPIRSFSSRIKKPQSINRKLRLKNLPLTVHSIINNLNDVAGVRVICEYISDVYAVRDALLDENFISILKQKDYIKHPKANGYRSLHLIVSVPVPLRTGNQPVRCEIQLRTTAMDSWAGLEHNLRYKKDLPYDPELDRQLLECADTLYQTDVSMQEIAEKLGVLPIKCWS